ncbi:MAG: hypothetical protein Kow0019_15740 [Methanobacteriaceae archaeon]
MDPNALHNTYSTSELMRKKISLVSSKIQNGKCLLDIGCGSGELLSKTYKNFKNCYGIDLNSDSIKFCAERFKNKKNISVFKLNALDLKKKFKESSFDYVTALDVLEHLKKHESEIVINNIKFLLKEQGIFILTAPNWYDKIKIKLQKTDFHEFSHSSYGWAKLIQKFDFQIISIECVSFPIFKGNEFLRKRLHIFGMCPLIVARNIKG